MASTVRELKQWLNTLDEASVIAIDEGGLTIVQVGGIADFELGGEPDDDEIDPTPNEADLRGPDRDEWKHEAAEWQRLK